MIAISFSATGQKTKKQTTKALQAEPNCVPYRFDQPTDNYFGWANIGCFRDEVPTHDLAISEDGDVLIMPLMTVTNNAGSGATLNPTTRVLNVPPPAGVSNTAAYSAGTVYTLTTTSQKVDFGTTDPVVTIPSPGTYLIFTNIKLEANGLTLAVARQSDFKLRRTNNTAADIPNAVTNFKSPILSVAQNGTAGDVDIPVVKYTTTNSNDVLELWGSISGTTLTGTMTVGEASVVAVKIY